MQFFWSVCRTSRIERSYSRKIVIFEQTIIFYDLLEIFLWESFPWIHYEERNRKAKGSAQVTGEQRIFSTDAAPDVNSPSPAQRVRPALPLGRNPREPESRTAVLSSSRYNSFRAHRNQILATILISAMAWKRGFLSNLHIGKCT